jgi:CubicO group peptidase (beta-lactamase class C family)
MTPRKMLLLCAVILSAGCMRQGEDPRTACVKGALEQPELADGVAVFTTQGVTGEAHSGWLNTSDGDSVLDMASLTKPLVAAEVRRRIRAGRLDLEQPIRDLLPGTTLVPETASITLRQLLQHRAGFDRSGGDPLFAEAAPSCSGAARNVLGRRPERAAGEQVLYSNAGYCILGEILLKDPSGLEPGVVRALQSPLGAAGGWRGSLRQLHAALSATLPLTELPAAPTLPDGSHYAYAWRSWPNTVDGPRWSHFGRLPGMLSLAVSDGEANLLVAHFTGDPGDVDAASAAAAKSLWRCMR